MTLDDFSRRLDTRLSKIERYQSKCAQNIVMALMTPTPVALFLLNPISLLIWMVLAVWWIGAWVAAD